MSCLKRGVTNAERSAGSIRPSWAVSVIYHGRERTSGKEDVSLRAEAILPARAPKL